MKRTLRHEAFATNEELWDFFKANKLAYKHTSSFFANGRFHLVW